MIHFPNIQFETTGESAKYALAQWTPDPLRQEARNVGIFVEKSGKIACRFIGEKNTAFAASEQAWDSSALRIFQNPSVYKLWVDNWRRKSRSTDLDTVLKSGSDQFHLVPGGEVEASGLDSSQQICEYLFNALVDPRGSIGAAIDIATDETAIQLKNELIASLREIDILGPKSKFKFPVVANRDLRGRKTWHRAPFFQESESQCWSIDSVDFTQGMVSNAVRKATFVYCEVDDLIGQKVFNKTFNAITVIKTDADSMDSEQVSWSVGLLRDKTFVVNWGIKDERKSFLREREKIAISGELNGSSEDGLFSADF